MTFLPSGVRILARNPEVLFLLRQVPPRVLCILLSSQKIFTKTHNLLLYHKNSKLLVVGRRVVGGEPALKGEAVRWAASPTVRNCRGFHATKAHSPDPSLAAVAWTTAHSPNPNCAGVRTWSVRAKREARSGGALRERAPFLGTSVTPKGLVDSG